MCIDYYEIKHLLIWKVYGTSSTCGKYRSWIQYSFIAHEIQFHFPFNKSLNIYSSTKCNPMIASNIQIHEHNNLALLHRATLMEARGHFKSL